MEKQEIVELLNKMLTELIIFFGVLAARYQVVDEVIWEVVKLTFPCKTVSFIN